MTEINNESFFQYVEKCLIPSIRKDGWTDLGDELESMSYPIDVGALKKIPGYELNRRKNAFLKGILSLPNEYKSILNRHAKEVVSQDITDNGVLTDEKIKVYLYPEKHRNAVFARAIEKITLEESIK